MTKPSTGSSQWVVVDEGWGREAVDFATLSEPGNCREYVAVHHRLGVGEAEFHRVAVEQAQGRLQDGLPLRAEINVTGYLARKPEGAARA
jgi:hypothetical protein